MELMQWFFMGVLFTVGVFGLSYLSLVVKLKWYTWACLIVGIVAILFGIGWIAQNDWGCSSEGGG